MIKACKTNAQYFWHETDIFVPSLNPNLFSKSELSPFLWKPLVSVDLELHWLCCLKRWRLFCSSKSMTSGFIGTLSSRRMTLVWFLGISEKKISMYIFFSTILMMLDNYIYFCFVGRNVFEARKSNLSDERSRTFWLLSTSQ